MADNILSLDMSLILTEELELLRHGFDDHSLQVVINEHWGSHFPNHRDSIQKDLQSKTSLIDFSVSHTIDLGGYFASEKKHQRIGFDIERADRISKQVARRICKSDQEAEAAPSPASLWTAKESAFKALKGPWQPRVLSEIVLKDWMMHSYYETCGIQNAQKYETCVAKGIILKKAFHVFSFFIVQP